MAWFDLVWLISLFEKMAGEIPAGKNSWAKRPSREKTYRGKDLAGKSWRGKTRRRKDLAPKIQHVIQTLMQLDHEFRKMNIEWQSLMWKVGRALCCC